MEGDSSTEIALPEVVVIPGEPAEVHVTTKGNPGVDGSSEMLLTARVFDAEKNLVPDNTTVGFSTTGGGVLSKTLAYTSGGVAEAALTGGFLSNETGQVVIDAGSGFDVVDFIVRPPQAIVSEISESVLTGQTLIITASVLGPAGEPAQEVYVDATTTSGELAPENGRPFTDALGRIRLRWYTGDHESDEAILSARVGDTELFRKTVAVRSSASVSGAIAGVVFGSDTEAGSMAYRGVDERLSGALTYSSSDDIEVRHLVERSGSSLEDRVTLGTRDRPNRAPLLELTGTDFRPSTSLDDTGQVRLENQGISISNAHPSTRGESLRFLPSGDSSGEGSSITTDFSPEPANQVVVIDVRPSAPGGSLATAGDWFQLAYDDTGRFVASIRSTGGSDAELATVESAPAARDSWHRIVVDTSDNRLRLWLGDELKEVPVPGGWPLQDDNGPLLVGEGFSGEIARLAWFDSDSPPLLTFPDGEEAGLLGEIAAGESSGETYAPEDVNEESQSMVVRSTGSFDLPAGARAGLHEVGVSIGTNTWSILVVDDEEYQRTGSFLTDSAGSTVDWTSVARRIHAHQGRGPKRYLPARDGAIAGSIRRIVRSDRRSADAALADRDGRLQAHRCGLSSGSLRVLQ